jgi:RHS repeat-associated protein
MSSSCHHYYAYSYDGVGNRTQLETKKATTTYSYDAADGLLSTSKLKLHDHHPDVTTYAYDLNGNQTRSGDRHFAYNLENKLVEVMDKHGHDKVSYTYVEDGLMQTRSEGSEITAYSWDTLGDLPELAVETTSKKSSWHFEIKDSRSYTYGEGPIGIEAGRDTITFHTDSLGSVVQLSGERGRLLQSYRYSPFGGDYSPHSSLDAKSDDLNPIRFTGQYLDSETDLYNMRAREYDPETGRFLETDPATCDEGGACGSVYVYVDDQPTVMTDPSGMCPIDESNGRPRCMDWNNPEAAQHECRDKGANITCRSGSGLWPLWGELGQAKMIFKDKHGCSQTRCVDINGGVVEPPWGKAGNAAEEGAGLASRGWRVVRGLFRGKKAAAAVETSARVATFRPSPATIRYYENLLQRHGYGSLTKAFGKEAALIQKHLEYARADIAAGRPVGADTWRDIVKHQKGFNGALQVMTTSILRGAR